MMRAKHFCTVQEVYDGGVQECPSGGLGDFFILEFITEIMRKNWHPFGMGIISNEGLPAKEGHKMGRISGIGLILTAVAMIFGGLAFGDQAGETVRPFASSTVSGIFMAPEDTYALKFPIATDARKRDLSQFENDSQIKARSGYQSGKIPLAGNGFDPAAKFVSTLAVGRYKEENALSLSLDKFKEEDILRSLAIFFELKLNF